MSLGCSKSAIPYLSPCPKPSPQHMQSLGLFSCTCCNLPIQFADHHLPIFLGVPHDYNVAHSSRFSDTTFAPQPHQFKKAHTFHGHAPQHKNELPPKVHGPLTKEETERKKETKFQHWLATELTDDEKAILRELITVDGDLESMVTPYPVAKCFADYLFNFAKKHNLFHDNGTVAWMDAMSGSGMDSVAIRDVFGEHVLMSIFDIDGPKLDYVKKLIESK